MLSVWLLLGQWQLQQQYTFDAVLLLGIAVVWFVIVQRSQCVNVFAATEPTAPLQQPRIYTLGISLGCRPRRSHCRLPGCRGMARV